MKKQLWVNKIFWREEEVTWKDIKNGYLIKYATTPFPTTGETDLDVKQVIIKQVFFEYNKKKDIFSLNNLDIYLDEYPNLILKENSKL